MKGLGTRIQMIVLAALLPALALACIYSWKHEKSDIPEVKCRVAELEKSVNGYTQNMEWIKKSLDRLERKLDRQ